MLHDIELQAIEELAQCWRRHIKKRNHLLEEQTSKLTEHMLSKGIYNEESDVFTKGIAMTVE